MNEKIQNIINKIPNGKTVGHNQRKAHRENVAHILEIYLQAFSKELINDHFPIVIDPYELLKDSEALSRKSEEAAYKQFRYILTEKNYNVDRAVNEDRYYKCIYINIF